MQIKATACNIPFLIALIVSSILQAQITEPIIARKSIGDKHYQSLRSNAEALRNEARLDNRTIQNLYAFGKGSLHYAGMILQEYQSFHAIRLFKESYKKDVSPWSLLSLRELLWQYSKQEQWREIIQALPRGNSLLRYRDFYFLRMSALYRLERYDALLDERRQTLIPLSWNRVSERMLYHEEYIWQCIAQFVSGDPLWIETLAYLVFDIDDETIHRRLHIYMSNQDEKIRNSSATALLLDTLAAKFYLGQNDFKQAQEIFTMLIPRYAQFSKGILDALYTAALGSESIVKTANALANQTNTHQNEFYLFVSTARLFREAERYTRAAYYYTKALELESDQAERMRVYAEWVWVIAQNNPLIITDILEEHAASWAPYAPYFNNTLEALLAELIQKESWITIGALHRLLTPWKNSRAAQHISLAYALSPISTASEQRDVFTDLHQQRASPFAAAIASIYVERVAPVFILDTNYPGSEESESFSSIIAYDYTMLGLTTSLQTMLEDFETHPHIVHHARVLQNTGLSYWVFKALNTSDYGTNYEAMTNFYPVLYTDTIDYENIWVILALIREESRFHPTIRSPAGAVGLMQLIPATAAEVSRKHKIPFKKLEDAEHNISLGVAYAEDLSKRFENHGEIIAAYNAGPGRVRSWKSRFPANPVHFALSIPFRETRNHVRKVFESFLWYTALYEAALLIDAPKYFFALDESDLRN